MNGPTPRYPSTLRRALVVVVARIAVPLWLGAGAVLKLVDGSPSNLPAALVKWAGGLGFDLRFILEFSITAELVVAGVMVLLPGLARPVGVAMLASFVPVLVGDVAMGAASCGCFGAVQVSPWVTLTTDVFFLICLVFLARGVDDLKVTATLPTWRVAVVGIWTIASVGVAFGLTAPGGQQETSEGGDLAAAASGPAEGYYLPEYDRWIGRPFAEIEVAAWIDHLPDDLDQGQQYVLFYRVDCEHCHELMEIFFAGPLAIPTTAVAVPERAGFPTTNVQPFVCDECRLAELPSGVDWFMQTPVIVKLDAGIVQCAAEVTADDPRCLDVY